MALAAVMPEPGGRKFQDSRKADGFPSNESWRMQEQVRNPERNLRMTSATVIDWTMASTNNLSPAKTKEHSARPIS
jgi:hypothetical protein